VLPGLVAVLIAVIGPWVMPHSPAETIGPAYHGPAPGYPLGTDYLGRDVLSRILDGGHDLLVLPVIATALATTVGVQIGITIGYLGGRLDSTIMRLIDVLLAIPALLVLLVIVSGWGGGRTTLVIAVALTGWPFIARLTRSATLQVVTSAYLEQARAAGEGTASILAREVLPNIAGPLLANAGLFLVASFYLVASASYLGFVSGGPTADWAVMINENIQGIALSPYAVVIPVILIAALAISVNLLVDRLAGRLGR
jgi:peptide/nickel transport system permease protein